MQRPKWGSRPPYPFLIRSNSSSTLNKAESTSSKYLGLCTGKMSIPPTVAPYRSCKRQDSFLQKEATHTRSLSQLHRRRQRTLPNRNRSRLAPCRFLTLLGWRHRRRNRLSSETRQALRCAKTQSRLDPPGSNSHRRLRRSGRVPRLHRGFREIRG